MHLLFIPPAGIIDYYPSVYESDVHFKYSSVLVAVKLANTATGARHVFHLRLKLKLEKL